VPDRGSVALVTYLPEPLASFLATLRERLAPDHNPPPHITLLPPRPLLLPVDTVSAEADRIMSRVEPFEVELGGIRVFPRTNILYLNVEAGTNALHELHSSLNMGHFFAEECFEFVPHVTLSGPLASDKIAAALEKAETWWQGSDLTRRFRVDQVELLWQPVEYSEKHWTRLSAYPLKRQLTQT